MRQINNVTIGADPELFIVNTKTNKVVSAIGIIPGEKGKAYTDGLPEGFGLQIDNILGEFNIPPVSLRNVRTITKHIEFAKNFIDKYVKKINPDLGILCKASMYVDDDQLLSEEAQLFGCNVDYNVYTMSENPKPKGTETNLRTAGCHIHIGYDTPNTMTSVELVKYMDAILGVSTVLIDDDCERRKLYGRAGCFRITDYGVEYRVLSGYMISSPALIDFIADATKTAIDCYNSSYGRPHDDALESIINDNDKEMAKFVIDRYFKNLGLIESIDRLTNKENIINEETIKI